MAIHSKKLKTLFNKHPNSHYNSKIDRKRWVLNISSKPLSDTETSALQKGLNFAVAPKTVPTAEIVAKVEGSITGLSCDDKLVLRSQVSQVLQRAKAPPPNLPRSELKALRDLRKDHSLLVISADKGNCTVVMDRKDYDNKVKQMLSDQKTYKILKKDPTRCTERKLNVELLKLKREEKISESLYLQLRSSDGVPPRFYGLPKIHKPGYPLRPIVSFIDSPTYNTSKHIAKILSPLVGNTDYTVRNSKEFCASLEQVKLEQDVELVSFDVVSLFTSIPVEHAVQVAESKLSQDETPQSRSAIPITDTF